MSRALFIGGFGSSEEMLQPVGEALGKHFEEVDVLSLRYAEGNPDIVRAMALDAEVFAHSGGIGPTANTQPSALHGLGAAIPTWSTALLWRTVGKQLRMHRETPQEAKEFERQSTREILGNPGFHIRELFRVAHMDALGIADHHQKQGRPATLAFFENDAYFRLQGRNAVWAESSNLKILHLPGQHDEPLLKPQKTIDEYLAAANELAPEQV